MKKDKMKMKSRLKRKIKSTRSTPMIVKILCWILVWTLKVDIPVERKPQPETSQNWETTLFDTKTTRGTLQKQYKLSGTMVNLETECFLLDGNRIQTGRLFGIMSSKKRNKLQRSMNGNGALRQNVSIIHWNLGSKTWLRKKI